MPTAHEHAAELPAAPQASAHEVLSHVMPAWVLVAVFAALMVLTGITVAAAGVNLGGASLLVAVAIATVKASLVALYFMHLRYDNRFFALIFLVGLAFLGLFLSLTLLDTLQYRPDIQSYTDALP
jgi:cytochrome c oxidase subunit IV